MKTYSNLIEKIWNMEEFQKLAQIGGHKVFHLEGDALQHTRIVKEAAEEMWGKGHFMTLVATLHDIGKIYSSVCNGPGDWVYPHHSDGGAEKLINFIPSDLPEFTAIKWYVFNHMKPLFWFQKNPHELEVELEGLRYSAPSGLCRLDWLRDLTLCDIKGSHPIPEIVESNKIMVKWLKSLDL